MVDIVTFALLADEIVPALVIVVIPERVAVGGKGKVAPALLVKVVGPKTKVPFAGNVIEPEFVTPMVAVLEKVTVDPEPEKLIVPEFVKLFVPEFEEIVIGEVEEKLIVQLELFVNPVFVIAVKLARFSVA
jgi:hypothetical protein